MEKIFVNCKYRDEIIVPLVCVSPNFELLSIPDKHKVGILCLMKDGILAKIRGFEMKTIFEFEEDIKRLYKVELTSDFSIHTLIINGIAVNVTYEFRAYI